MNVCPPPIWTESELEADALAAIEIFKETRWLEPLEAYLSYFEVYRQQVEGLIETTVDLANLTNHAVELLTQKESLTAIRYLASPAISEDDLMVLADAMLTPTRLRNDQEMAKRVISTVMMGLDRERFPWVSENRDPTETERAVAVVSTAALIATQKVHTERRNGSKNIQEEAVAQTLIDYGFEKVPPRDISNTQQFPDLGEFCGESLFGGRKADLVVRLWDGRVMPIECKVSNSSTNSIKRLNNDAVAKAVKWLEGFGTASCVPAAVLSGVFKVRNLESAQQARLTIFWAHRLDALTSFIDETKM